MNNPLWCPHTAHTPSDHEGYAICLKCGTVIRVWLSKQMVDKAIADGLKKGFDG